MTDQRRRSLRAVAVLFGACLLAGAGAAAAQAGSRADLPGSPLPTAAPSVPAPTATGPAPSSPAPSEPAPSEPAPTDPPEVCAAPVPTASVTVAAVPAALTRVVKNKGPFKIKVNCSRAFSRKDLGVSENSLYTNCTIAGTIVRSCTVGGLGRQITVECGGVKGKDVIEVTVDQSGTETKFKVDIECI